MKAKLQEWYVRRRAYPDSSIDIERVLRAYRTLQAMRVRPYVPPINFNPPQPLTNVCLWQSIGPTNVNGRVTGIAIHSSNPNRIVVTTVGGVWRSSDGAQTWQRVSDLNVMKAGVFSTVAINPSDANEIFVAGGDANLQMLGRSGGPGIWRSKTGGDPGSWERVDDAALSNLLISRLRISPTVHNGHHDVYAATDGGVFVGHGSGTPMNWARLGSLSAPCSDLAVDFTASPPVILTGVYITLDNPSTSNDKGIWRFTGGAWSRVHAVSPSAAGGVIALAMAPSATNIVYAKIEDARCRSSAECATSPKLKGIFRSSNQGSTWTQVPGWQAPNADDSYNYSWFNSALEVDPNDPNILYVAGLWLYRYHHGGSGWKKIAEDTRGRWLHRDQHSIAIAPATGAARWLYVGNDGGLDRVQIPPAGTAWPADWHWQDCDHGMNVTEIYDLGLQHKTPTAIAAGTQDNGSPVTFGNLTWLSVATCDAVDVALDAPISSTLYEGCMQPATVVGYGHPLVEPLITRTGIPWDAACNRPCPPMTADASSVGRAIAARCTEDGSAPALLKLQGDRCWTDAQAPLAGRNIECVAIARSSSFMTYYVGVSNPGNPPSIWTTIDAGITWFTTPVGLSDPGGPTGLLPNEIEVDPLDATRAFSCWGGGNGSDVYMTTDTGHNWSRLVPSGQSIEGAGIDIAIDPSNHDVLYLATGVGIYRGTVSLVPSPGVRWDPFDEGLPNGVDVTSLELIESSPAKLVIGTMGYGGFERVIAPGVTCPRTLVSVRDNVFDKGTEPVPFGYANPEDPIPDPSRPAVPGGAFYKHNDSQAGKTVWWTSPDVRISVPSVGSDVLPDLIDHVSVESCPITAGFCPPGTVDDESPQRGQQAMVFVQVYNRGTQIAHNVRVMAMWANATTSLPLLPENFWTTNFPPGVPTCVPLVTGGAWNSLDPAGCQVIAALEPGMPRVLTFRWDVPMTAPTHACILVITEADEDLLPSSARTGPDRRHVWALVPQHHQIGLRNLHVVGTEFFRGLGSEILFCEVWNPTLDGRPIDLLVSRAGLPSGASVQVHLPPAADSLAMAGFHRVLPHLDPSSRTRAIDLGVSPDTAYVATGAEAEIRGLRVPRGQRWNLGVLVELPRRTLDKPGRFTLVARRDSLVLGGSTFVIPAGP